MLTYPSDSLPQIVCPMDEHAIPSNSFCSAPPHSEPPPPLLPLSSITPSGSKNETSGHRRSSRIQEIRAQSPKKQSINKDGAAQTPSRQNPSPTKRQIESANMGSQSKQPRVEGSHVHQNQNEDGFDSFAAECQNKQKQQKSPQEEPDISAVENAVEEFAVDATQTVDSTKSDMETCGGLAVGHTFEDASVPKRWVIGPLFQSLKLKMASFTEIVMSPVKLFRANSPPPCTDHLDELEEFELQAGGASDVEHSEPSATFLTEAQSENGNREAKANQQGHSPVETVALKCSKKLSFDVELPTHSSTQADERAIKEKNSPVSVPLQRPHSPCIVSEDVSVSVKSSVLLQPSVDVSASHASAMEDQKCNATLRRTPPPRKCTVNRSGVKKVTSKTSAAKVKKEESEVSDELNSVRSNKADAQPDCPPPDGGGDDGRKIESLFCPSHQDNLNSDANAGALKLSLDTQQLNPETYSAAGLGVKREVELDCHSQNFVKRKRLTQDASTRDAKRQELLNVASDSGILRSLRKGAVSTDPIVDETETLVPARKRPAVSTRANKKGKGGQEIQSALNTQTDGSSDAMLVCSLDKISGKSENNQKGISSKVKPSASCKRLKTRTGLGGPDVNIDNNSMALETSVAITSTKQAEQEALSELLKRPAVKPLQSTSKRRNISTKPLKRKSPVQSGSTIESDSTLFSTSSATSAEPLDLLPTDLNTSKQVQKEESSKKGLNQPSKRAKKGFKNQSSASGGRQDTKQFVSNLHLTAKENQPEEGKGQISMDTVYFEMTPFESIQPVPSPSQSNLDCHVQLDNDVKLVVSAASVSDEVFPSDAGNHSSVRVSGLRSSARRVNNKPRRAVNQRRKCRVLQSRTQEADEVTNSVTLDDADLSTVSSRSAGSGLSRRLMRSYSCPEIPSFRPHDMPWTSSVHSPHHSRIHPPRHLQSSHTPPVHHAHKSPRRARRHTVCSMEVEREIAPLCLRKEVYPTRRSLPFDRASQHFSPSLALSPSTSLSALASCFLSSPLAFLSKKVESRGASSSPSTSSHVSSPTSSSPTYPLILRVDSSSTSTVDYSSSGNLLECEIERRQSEEEDDGEDTSSSSQEFEDVSLREEKALSDSEIKVVQKHKERGKVSSIKIRKTLPKPQNNLTPMGLPKLVRLNKKEFSLEEIYTNKNFTKAPESRLETIFEVPLKHRNGSESWFGQRRLKRFLEFLGSDKARKPKKQLVGVGKAGASSSRTRRGGFPKDEPQDVDSLLCAKLNQLNLWVTLHQTDS